MFFYIAKYLLTRWNYRIIFIARYVAMKVLLILCTFECADSIEKNKKLYYFLIFIFFNIVDSSFAPTAHKHVQNALINVHVNFCLISDSYLFILIFCSANAYRTVHSGSVLFPFILIKLIISYEFRHLARF